MRKAAGKVPVSLIRTLKIAVMQRSRARKLDHFYSLYKGGSVLDCGVSGKEWLPADNAFVNTFRYHGRLYTGLGVEMLSEVADRHPDKKFVQYAGGTFPFKDKQFDWAFSNAVIEHVGNHDDQLTFVNEMLRVAKSVFVTTPNRYFPVEAHTNALFIHWNNTLFYQWCARQNKSWNERNLWLFSYTRLKQLMKQSNADWYEIYKDRLYGYPMTFTVVC